MNFRKVFIILVLICLPGVILSQINKEELFKTIQYLASKEIAGRVAGSNGFTVAADFMAHEFTKLNLKPAGDDNYF